MAGKTSQQEAKEILDLYILLYKGRFGPAPVLNRFKAKWGVIDMIDDLTLERAVDVVDFYVKHSDGAVTLDGLLYNYTEIAKTMDEAAADRARRAEIREQTRRRVEEWEKREH